MLIYLYCAAFPDIEVQIEQPRKISEAYSFIVLSISSQETE